MFIEFTPCQWHSHFAFRNYTWAKYFLWQILGAYLCVFAINNNEFDLSFRWQIERNYFKMGVSFKMLLKVALAFAGREHFWREMHISRRKCVNSNFKKICANTWQSSGTFVFVFFVSSLPKRLERQLFSKTNTVAAVVETGHLFILWATYWWHLVLKSSVARDWEFIVKNCIVVNQESQEGCKLSWIWNSKRSTENICPSHHLLYFDYYYFLTWFLGWDDCKMQ